MNLKIIVVSLTAGILLFAGYFAGWNYLRPVFRQNGTIYFESDPYFKNWDSGKQREYCAANGGKVNECGPLCENCVATVCSLTCEFAPRLKSDFNQNDVSGWKTYSNEKYGFEVKYPDNLFLSQRLDSIGIYNYICLKGISCKYEKDKVGVAVLTIAVKPNKGLTLSDALDNLNYLFYFPQYPAAFRRVTYLPHAKMSAWA